MLTLDPKRKIAGVLAPIFAIRGTNDLGVGDTAALREVVVWAAETGLGAVQVLPINETGNDHSPYNVLSAFAIEPATIATTPDELPDLDPEDFATLTNGIPLDKLRSGPVQYDEVKRLKRALLLCAYERFRRPGAGHARMRAFAKFENENSLWLDNYSLFRALMTENDEYEVIDRWPTAHQSPASAREWANGLPPDRRQAFRELVRFHAYVQWIAFEQWRALREFATAHGVALIGDIPVGVSRYSADVWGEPEIFDLTLSSGAPPEKVFKADPFTEKWGQNWGFPLYSWERMSRDNFAWWRRRMRVQTAIFDMLRVDHALGFFRIYSFPWPPHENDRFTDLSPDETRAITGGRLPGFVPRDDSTPENRDHNRRLGEMLFRVLLEETGPHRILAEDLGEVAPYVRPTLAQLEIPGFKIPQWERLPDGKIIPGSDYQRLSLATYATHDHPPMKVLWNDLVALTNADDANSARALDELNALLAFAGQKPTKKPPKYSAALQSSLLDALLASNSWLVVPMITDILGTSDRFNVPGSTGDANWTRRISQPVSRWNQTWASEVQSFQKSVAKNERGKFVA